MERSFLVASDDEDEEDAASLPSLIVQAVIKDGTPMMTGGMGWQ
jgi:hypothetical protein